MEFPPTPPATPFATTFLPGPPSPNKLHTRRETIVYQPSPPSSPGYQSSDPFEKSNKSAFELPRDARMTRGTARPKGMRTLSHSFGLTLRGTKEEEMTPEKVLSPSEPTPATSSRRSSAMLGTGRRSPGSRKTRLLTGICLSTALIFIAFLLFSPHKPASLDRSTSRATARPRRTKAATTTTPWHWPSHEVELAALLNFVLGEQHNHITYTENDTLSPDVVLEFDPRSAGGAAQLEEIKSTVFLNNPVILLTDDTRHSRFTRSTLDELNVKPQIVTVSHRADAAALLAVLERLVGSQTLPLLIVGGEVLGSWPEVHSLRKSGKLDQLIRQANAGTTNLSHQQLVRKEDPRAVELRKRMLEEMKEDEESRDKLLSAQLLV